MNPESKHCLKLHKNVRQNARNYTSFTDDFHKTFSPHGIGTRLYTVEQTTNKSCGYFLRDWDLYINIGYKHKALALGRVYSLGQC
jgi:hypothetical protein